MKTSVAFVVVIVVLATFADFATAMITRDPACHRMRTKVDKVRRHCVYLCHLPEGNLRMGLEEDGTPCRSLLHEGVCIRGKCRMPRPKKGVPAKGDEGDISERPE
ncbi:hypothetical protein V5799_027322 [Amblyomma americanum]|uniref:Secreted protein n=1 Tax=Amblyomma americanum TaxID=6943 RepID=A0AAQ4DG22_AMBAM